VVSSVAENSPADKAGLKENDVILEINGVRVEGTLQFGRLVSETPPGRAVTLKIVRDGKRMDIKATIGSRETVLRGPGLRGSLQIPLPEVRIPPVAVTISGFSALGVSVQSLSKQLGEYFGVTDGHGALITTVRPDTPAARAGLHAGDVIVAVDDREVSSPRDLSRALSGKEGDVSLTIIREKQRQTVRVTLERRERSDRHFFTFDHDAISEGVFDLHRDFDFDFDFDLNPGFDFNYDFNFPGRLFWFGAEKQRQAIEELMQEQQKKFYDLDDLQRRYKDELQRYQRDQLKRRLVDQVKRSYERVATTRSAAQARKARLETWKRNHLRQLLRKSAPPPGYKRLVRTTIL
jgi:serine protease Do